MMTMYVISNETGEIVATIEAGPSYRYPSGRNQNADFVAKFEEVYGSNDFTNSFTDFGSEYADTVEEIVL